MKRMTKSWSLWLVVLTGLLLLAVGPFAFSQSKADYEFYKGKVIKFIVPYSVGGGFDAYARAIAPFLEKYLPGAAVVVQNIPGGGGLIGTNTLYKAAPDGLTIGIINGAGMAFNQIVGTAGVEFDLAQMLWLCRASADPRAVVVGGKTAFRTVEDMKKAGRTIVFSATGVGSDDYYGSYVIFKALGIPFRNVTGFPGAAEANLAAVRGEGIDGTQCEISSLLQFIQEGSIRPFLVVTLKRLEAFPDVPTVLEVVPEESRDLVRTITNVFEANRVICAPPGVPEARAAALREVLEKAFKDPELLSWGKKSNRPLNYLDGPTMEKLIQEALKGAEKIKPVLEEATKR